MTMSSTFAEWRRALHLDVDILHNFSFLLFRKSPEMSLGKGKTT